MAERGDHFGSALGHTADGAEIVGVPGEDSGSGSVIVGLGTRPAYEEKYHPEQADGGYGSSVAVWVCQYYCPVR